MVRCVANEWLHGVDSVEKLPKRPGHDTLIRGVAYSRNE